MRNVNDILQSNEIAKALSTERYGRGLSAEIVRLLNRAGRDTLDRIAARLVEIEERGFDIGPASTARLNKLLAEIRAIEAQIAPQIADRVTDDLVDFSATEAAFQVSSLNAAIGIELATTLPSPARLKAIVTETPIRGKLLAPWLKQESEARISRVEQAIRLGMTAGESTDKIVARVRGTKAMGYRNGAIETNRNAAMTLVRTSVNHVSNHVAQETWKANTGILKGWQFLATLDERTSGICAVHADLIYPIGEGDIPPLHPNCRSFSVPITKSFRELGIDADELPEGTRASMNGQVAGKTTMAEWLRDQGAETQNQVLGATRAKLFREGKLDLYKFLKNDSSLYTIKELKAKYQDLF